MGLFSSSKSSSVSTTTNLTEDSRIAQEGSGAIIQGGADVSIIDQFPDQVAIYAENVTDLAKTTQETGASQTTAVLNFAKSIISSLQDSTKSIISDASSQVNKAVDLVSSKTESEITGLDLIKQAIPYIAVAFIGYAIIKR